MYVVLMFCFEKEKKPMLIWSKEQRCTEGNKLFVASVLLPRAWKGPYLTYESRH